MDPLFATLGISSILAAWAYWLMWFVREKLAIRRSVKTHDKFVKLPNIQLISPYIHPDLSERWPHIIVELQEVASYPFRERIGTERADYVVMAHFFAIILPQVFLQPFSHDLSKNSDNSDPVNDLTFFFRRTLPSWLPQIIIFHAKMRFLDVETNDLPECNGHLDIHNTEECWRFIASLSNDYLIDLAKLMAERWTLDPRPTMDKFTKETFLHFIKIYIDKFP